MLLINYLANRPRGFKSDFANKIGISRSFLRQIEVGYSKVPFRVAKRIEEATKGKVTKSELRPDIWD